MTDESHRFSDEDPELGEPIAELRELEESAESSFLARVRGRIQDRLFAGQIIDFSIPVFLQTVIEYVSMLFAFFGMSEEGQESEDR